MLHLFFISILFFANQSHAHTFVPQFSGKGVKIVTGNGIPTERSAFEVHVPSFISLDSKPMVVREDNNIRMRKLNEHYSKNLENDQVKGLICPLTKRIMSNPVTLIGDGYTYERDAIELWFNRGNTVSPITRKPLTKKQILPNNTVRRAINESRNKKLNLIWNQWNESLFSTLEALIIAKEIQLKSKQKKTDEKIISIIEKTHDLIDDKKKENQYHDQQGNQTKDEIDEENGQENDRKNIYTNGEKVTISVTQQYSANLIISKDTAIASEDLEVEKLLMMSIRNLVSLKRFQYSNGDIFEGNLRHNKQEGYGKFHFSNGQTYEGFFHQGMRYGFGIYTWPNGGRYEGFWKDDKRNGKAIFIVPNGHIIEGHYIDDKKQFSSNWKMV